MATLAVLTSIGITIAGFIGAFIFFYIVSPLPTLKKKKVIEDVASLLINFVIFIWLGKILINLPLFVRDPLAVLAYPSHSYAFYLATFFTAIHLMYKVKKRDFNVRPIFVAFVPIFLVASFIYEFIQLVWNEHTWVWPYLSLLVILIIIFILSHDRISEMIGAFTLIIGWNIGKVILVIILPLTTIFGYTISIWFLLILLIINITIFLYYRKRVTV